MEKITWKWNSIWNHIILTTKLKKCFSRSMEAELIISECVASKIWCKYATLREIIWRQLLGLYFSKSVSKGNFDLLKYKGDIWRQLHSLVGKSSFSCIYSTGTLLPGKLFRERCFFHAYLDKQPFVWCRVCFCGKTLPLNNTSHLL